GIINVRDLPAEYDQVDRKILVDRNVVAWSAELSDVVSQVSAAGTNGTSDWMDQMITMNTRTQAMFDDNASYPYLTEGVWYEQMPTFTDPQDLFTDQLTNFEEFCVATVAEDATALLPLWRLVYTGAEDYIYSDWPIPVDLSYSDANLLSGGIGGFPVGDLNWFPAEKATWAAQKDVEHAKIQTALDLGKVVGIANKAGVIPKEFEIAQNYPNPFNPTTTINFSLKKAGDVTLKVYDAVGREVATLVNGHKAASTYNVEFDASGLASGMYIYTIEVDNQKVSKKMVLMK
ncbi:T9SS type A sorting domain-containing protein, partial [candidate division KSB1 bacterium]|nr:T9SS type A sorting domain-containing protein [candidate division KSB1 bacterium]